MAAACRVGLDSAALSPGKSIRPTVELATPADPPRRLLPFLLELRGRAGKTPFTLAIPLDLSVGDSLEMKPVKADVVRGRQQTLNLVVANRFAGPMQATLRFAAAGKVRIEPVTVPLTAAGRAAIPVHVELHLDKSVPIGPLRIDYACESSTRFRMQAPLWLSVGEP